MQFFDDGDIILLGDEAALSAPPVMAGKLATAAIALVALLGPLPVAAAIGPEWGGFLSTLVPLEIAGAVTVGGALLVRWWLVSFLAGGVVAAVFHRSEGFVEVMRSGLFGIGSRRIAFSEIRAIQMGRGEWSGESVVNLPILHLHSGAAVALVPGMTDGDLMLLRALTGIRRA